jgi:hypothetical protein
VIGGWQLTGINVVTIGVPINLTYTANTNQVVSTTSSVYSLRPNLVSALLVMFLEPAGPAA